MKRPARRPSVPGALAAWVVLAVPTLAQPAPLARLPREADVLTIEVEAGQLMIATAGGGTRWRLSFDAAGAHWNGPAAAACLHTMFAAVDWPDEARDGRIDAGESARVFVATTYPTAAGPRSSVAAVQIEAQGGPRLVWSHDATTLPQLGRLAAPPTPVHDGAREHDAVALGTGWSVGDTPSARTGALLLLDAATGALRAVVHRVDAPMPGGITAVDVDADGRTDRLYATDAGMRLWRIDRSSAPGAAGGFSARLLADLRPWTDPHAAFVHAPDVALRTSGAVPWLDVSVGTSNRPGEHAAQHRLFRVVDTAAAGVPPPRTAPAIVELEGELAAVPLTVAGRQLVATRRGDATSTCAAGHPSPVVVSALPPSLPALSREVDLPHVGLTAAPGDRLRLEALPSREGGPSILRCAFGETALALCPPVRRLERRYWLRKDAP